VEAVEAKADEAAAVEPDFGYPSLNTIFRPNSIALRPPPPPLILPKQAHPSPCRRKVFAEIIQDFAP
jgi:hypothetical protein